MKKSCPGRAARNDTIRSGRAIFALTTVVVLLGAPRLVAGQSTPTAAFTPTEAPAFTPTPPPAFTATPAPAGLCGNGVVDPPGGVCVGDCDGSGSVTQDEVVTCTNILRGRLPVSSCLACDPNADGIVDDNEVAAANNNSVNGC